jgi:hypothetical protein
LAAMPFLPCLGALGPITRSMAVHAGISVMPAICVEAVSCGASCGHCASISKLYNKSYAIARMV